MSTDMRVPSPEQAGHAPNGALKEKVRGSISVRDSAWPCSYTHLTLPTNREASILWVSEKV